MIIKSVDTESSHWYSQDGSPAYRIIGKNGKERNTNVRDARELNLVPSVTTVLGLVAKPGLDGHSNGAEQIAVAARDAGMEVVYSGIRLTPEQIVASARDEDPDVVGLSILSGSHMQLVPEVVRQLRAEGVDAPVIVGGIIPEEDRELLMSQGVAAVYTPKDFDISRIMREVAELAVAYRA
jgi:(2R)-ethylmalonyl-CoA mutase